MDAERKNIPAGPANLDLKAAALGASSVNHNLGNFFTSPEAYRQIASGGMQHAEAVSLVRFLSENVRLSGDITILDAGCGDGSFSFSLLGKGGRLIGVDKSPQMLSSSGEYLSARGVSVGRDLVSDGACLIEGDLGAADAPWVKEVISKTDSGPGVGLIFSNATLHHIYSSEGQINFLDNCARIFGVTPAATPKYMALSFAAEGNFGELVEAAEHARQLPQFQQLFEQWSGYPLLRPGVERYRELVELSALKECATTIRKTEITTFFENEEKLEKFCTLCLRSFMNHLRSAATHSGMSPEQIEIHVGAFAKAVVDNYLTRVARAENGEIPLVSKNLEVVIDCSIIGDKRAAVAGFTDGLSQDTRRETELVGFLDAVSAFPEVVGYMPLKVNLLDIKPGSMVLDAGAGCGNDALAFAPLVGNGRIVALDKNPFRVNVIANRAQESGFQNVIAIQGDVQDLANHRSAFDRVFVERTLIHVPDIKRAVRELLGVLKPGGKLVLVEPDFTTVSFNSEMPEVTSKIVGMRAKQIRNPTAGALLGSLLRAEEAVVEEVIERPLVHSYATASLLDLNDIRALAVGASRPGAEEKTLAENGLTAPEVINWLAEQARLASNGTFNSVTAMHFIRATKK